MGQGFQLFNTLNTNIITIWNTFTGHAFKLAVIAGRLIYPWRSCLYLHLFVLMFFVRFLQDVSYLFRFAIYLKDNAILES